MLIEKDKQKLLQKEIIELVNEAYDRGGADILKIIIDATKNIAKENPKYSEHAAFTLYVIEGVRQTLEETVSNEKHDTIPEPSNIIKV